MLQKLQKRFFLSYFNILISQFFNFSISFLSSSYFKVKQEIRHIRKTTLDEVKALKGSISEDDTKRISKEVIIFSNKIKTLHLILKY